MFTESHLQAFDSVVRRLKTTAWLCGGTVRDLLLGRPFHDVDVVLADRVFEAAEMFANAMHVPSFVLDRERFVARVVFGKSNWDITGFRNSTIEGDLRKRDFTVNAMAIRWEDFYPGRSLQKVLDPFGGIADLQARVVRAVTTDSLTDDPLRMLRAYRIHAELGFQIDPAVLQQMEQIHERIADVAGERVRDELDRILLQPDSYATWRVLGETSLFDSLFPEMKPMKHCEQGGYHHLDVWGHCVEALGNLERILMALPDLFPAHAPALMKYLTTAPGTLHRSSILKWAAILHDIGKPRTREMREPGRWRFHGHDHMGVDLTQELLARLKFARKDTQSIVALIEHHLRPLNIFKLPEHATEHFHRFFRAAGPEAVGVLLLSIADMTAARGPLADRSREAQFRILVGSMLDYYYLTYYPAVSTPELVRGRDLMAFLQMKPGPQMGDLLKEIREAQLSGTLRTRDDALEFARAWLKNK